MNMGKESSTLARNAPPIAQSHPFRGEKIHLWPPWTENIVSLLSDTSI